jgi:hypothetical protein
MNSRILRHHHRIRLPNPRLPNPRLPNPRLLNPRLPNPNHDSSITTNTPLVSSSLSSNHHSVTEKDDPPVITTTITTNSSSSSTGSASNSPHPSPEVSLPLPKEEEEEPNIIRPMEQTQEEYDRAVMNRLLRPYQFIDLLQTIGGRIVLFLVAFGFLLQFLGYSYILEYNNNSNNNNNDLSTNRVVQPSWKLRIGTIEERDFLREIQRGDIQQPK